MNGALRALVVGIDNYPTQPLAGCVADARLLGEVLERHDDGSPNFDVRYLTSDVTRDSLFVAIEELLEQPADVALLHFSGHGLLTSAGGHLVTVDHSQRTPGLLSHELMTLVADSPATKSSFSSTAVTAAPSPSPRPMRRPRPKYEMASQSSPRPDHESQHLSPPTAEYSRLLSSRPCQVAPPTSPVE